MPALCRSSIGSRSFIALLNSHFHFAYHHTHTHSRHTFRQHFFAFAEIDQSIYHTYIQTDIHTYIQLSLSASQHPDCHISSSLRHTKTSRCGHTSLKPLTGPRTCGKTLYGAKSQPVGCKDGRPRVAITHTRAAAIGSRLPMANGSRMADASRGLPSP